MLALMEYQLKKIERSTPAGNWDRAPWDRVPALRLENFMGQRPAHLPQVDVKAAWDDEAVRVIFRVEDRYVRAVAAADQGAVWQDSCVEFFFTPGPEVSPGYFNLETNCGGVKLFHHQKTFGVDRVLVAADDLERIEIFHSLPRIVEPEMEGPITWQLEYRLPVDILAKYAPFIPPAPGVTWRGNFYKCADKTSHPHWLTWNRIERPTPAFHVPECFGALKFL